MTRRSKHRRTRRSSRRRSPTGRKRSRARNVSRRSKDRRYGGNTVGELDIGAWTTKPDVSVLSTVVSSTRSPNGQTCVPGTSFNPTPEWRKVYETTMEILDRDHLFMFQEPSHQMYILNMFIAEGDLLTITNTDFVSGNNYAKQNRPLSLEDMKTKLVNAPSVFHVFRNVMTNIEDVLKSERMSPSEHGGQNEVWARIDDETGKFVLKRSLQNGVQKLKFASNMVAIHAEIMAPYIRFHYNGQYWILMEELKPATTLDDHVQYLSKIKEWNNRTSSPYKLVDYDYHIHQLGKRRNGNVLRWDQEGLDLRMMLSYMSPEMDQRGVLIYKPNPHVVCKHLPLPAAAVLKSLMRVGYNEDDVSKIREVLEPVIKHKNFSITAVTKDVVIRNFSSDSMINEELTLLLASSCIVLMIVCTLKKQYIHSRFKYARGQVDVFTEDIETSQV